MEKPLVSIVLPVYNVEEYLEKCLETVVSQTYRNLEILLIDDGSQDSSAEICDKWKDMDDRIVVVHKINNGLGMARNTGLDYAHGQFVMFVDSDDFVETNAVEKLLQGIRESDTVFCGHIVYFGEEKLKFKPIKYGGLTFEGDEVQNKILTEMMGGLPSDIDDIILPVSVWHGLYSMDIIRENQIYFPSERQYISEDMIFHIDYLSKAKKISFISDCLYYYRKNNENSLTSVYNPERFAKEVILYKELRRKLGRIIPEEQFILRLQRTFLGRVRSCMVRAEMQCLEPKKEIRQICNNTFVREVLKEYPYHHCRIQLRIFNFCVYHKMVCLLHLLIKSRYGN